MDDLKKYLQAHHDELDMDTPRDPVWQRIEAQTQTNPRANIAKIIIRYCIAACTLAIVAFGVKWIAQHNDKNDFTKVQKPIAIDKDTQIVVENTHGVGSTNDALVLNDKAIKTQQKQVVTKANTTAKKIKPSRQINQLKGNDVNPNVIIDPITKALENNYVQLVGLQVERLRSTPVFAEGPDYFQAFKIQLKQMDEDEAAIRKDIKINGMQDGLLEKLINVYQQKLNVLKNLQTEINKMNNRVKQNQLPSDSSKSYFLNI